MTAKRFTVVVNPRGGTRRGPAVLEHVRPLFAAADATLDVHVTKHAGHAAELARSLDLTGVDGFCVVGGDGTIHEAVGGLMQRSDPAATPLGVIPGGTGNSVLEHLKCPSPDAAVRRILTGSAQPLDVVRVSMAQETVDCINIIGWGAVVDVNRTAERLRAIGPSRYAVAALQHILRPVPRRARLVLDGRVDEDAFLLAAECNTKYTGKRMLLAPDAELGNGTVDVVLVRRASRWQLLQMFRRVFDGSHVELPCVETHRVRSFAIEQEAGELLNLDGELKGRTPCSAKVLPGALRIFA